MSLSVKNENRFLTLCEKLKKCKQETPWTPVFEKIESPLHFPYEDIEGMEIVGHLHHNSAKMNNPGLILRTVEQPVLCISKCNSDQNQIGTIDFEGQVDEDKILQLKNMLSSISEGQLAEDHQLSLELFQSVPALSIPLLCHKLNVESIDETSLATLLKALSCMNQPICQSSANAFVQHAVYPRVLNLKSNTPRALITAIVTFTECYPRAVIEGLFLPCLNSNVNGSMQTDLLIKIIKCNLPDDLIFLCERKCIEISEVNESSFHLVQCIIERKALQDTDFYDALLRTLKDWSLSHNSNLKFTKLLIAVATTFGSKMNDDQLAALRNIVKNNSTLLKKAAENVLNKIKK